MEIKVLIVDDEPGMRLLLSKSVAKVQGFSVIGEAASGEEALALFKEASPEVVFMDVELEAMSGVECAEKILEISPKTMIIFATGHNEYMPRAFEIYAFDYIIKPFKIERIFQTLNRIKDIVNKRPEPRVERNTRLLSSVDKLIIKNKEGISFVDTFDIILIQREDKATVIYTPTERYVTSEALGDIEEKLDPSKFMRSHKSYIINISKITKIYPYGRWTYVVKLKGTEMDALLTHENYQKLKDLFDI